MNNDFPGEITIGEKYAPAMEITDPELAKDYFERCVRHQMRFGIPRDIAEETERKNLGYFAGYYNLETRKRVEKLFGAEHPIFGTAGPSSPDAAMLAGVMMAKGLR